MLLFTNEIMRDLLSQEPRDRDRRRERLARRRQGPGSTEGAFINFLTIGDLEQSVVDDVRRIRSHPLVPPTIPISGFVYDVKTGRLIEVAEASRVGAATA